MTAERKPVALVTGGGGGIGAACAKVLAKTYEVAVIDQDYDTATRIAAEVDGRARRCDVSSAAEVAATVAWAREGSRRISALVMCAGLIQDRPLPPEELDEGTWDRIQAVNAKGTWLVAKAAGAAMIETGSGAIVLVASIAGQRSWPTHAYSASKAAVISLARGLAAEWGRSGIRVNSISPGFTMTEKLKALVETRGWDTAGVAAQTALGRWVEPEEIAAAAAFLVSDGASAITGIDLPVDAGWLCGINWGAFVGVPGPRSAS